jgi:hypothetical protein
VKDQALVQALNPEFLPPIYITLYMTIAMYISIFDDSHVFYFPDPDLKRNETSKKKLQKNSGNVFLH